METSLKLQMDVKNNAEDLRRYMLDLNNWEEEMKRKERELKNGVNKVADLPPPRNKIKRNSSEKSWDNKKFSEEEKKMKRIHAYDYSAWDKYDADKACAELDEEANEEKAEQITVPEEEQVNQEEKQEVENGSETLKNIDEAFYEKQLGNLFVKTEKWEDAIKCYTKAIDLDSTNAIYYANRSLCFLKLKNFKSAEVDATVAIQLDGTYIKAYQRRAVARKALGQYQEAISDYREILKLEPKNAFANVEISKLEKLNVSGSKVEEKKPIFDPRSIFKSEPKKVSKEVLKKKECTENLGKNKVEEKKKNVENSLQGCDKSAESLGKNKAAEKGEAKDSLQGCDNEKKIVELETNENVKNSNDRLPVFGKVPEGFAVVKPVHVPPHLRSKQPLRRIPVKEVFSDAENFDEFINLSNSTKSDSEENPSENEKKPPTDNVKNIQEKETNSDNLNFPVPVTCVQFQQAWKYVKNNIQSTYYYLKEIKPDNLFRIFQHSLESDLFSELISRLAQDELLKDYELVYSFLYHLSKVQRFGSLVLFMSHSDRENLNKCITCLGQYKSSRELEELCNLYEMKKDDRGRLYLVYPTRKEEFCESSC